MSKGTKPNAGTLLEIHLRELGKEFRREWEFSPGRKWRFDYVLGGFVNSQHWEHSHIAIEIEGAVWTQGRHTRGAGYLKDLEKYNQATRLGWKVFRFSTQQVLDGTAKAFLKEFA